MSCSGFHEILLRKAKQEKLQKQVLEEIQQRKDTLKRKLQSLMVQGDFHRANQVKVKLEKLEKIRERMKQFLEV